MSAPTKPVVGIVGPTGYLGRDFTPAFIQAAKQGLFGGVRLLTRDPSQMLLRPYANDPSGLVQVVKLFYKKAEFLEPALQGIDILVNVMKTTADTLTPQRYLITAAAKCGIKIYLPSEYDMDYTKTTRQHHIYAIKQRHFEEAEALGLKVVGIHVGYITDMTFFRYFGIDTQSNRWTMPGDGNQPAAFTARKDIAQYALRAALMTYADPTTMPSRLRVYSDVRTWNECAALMENEAGERLSRRYTPIPKLVIAYDMALFGMKPGAILSLSCAEGFLDYSTDSHNDLLNPEQSFFTPYTIAEYAKDVGGRPWLTGNPFRN